MKNLNYKTLEIDTRATNSSTMTINISNAPILENIYDLFKYCRHIRKRRGLTQKELGRKLSISQSMVSFAERNPEEVQIGYWYEFVKHFNLGELSMPKWGFMK